MSRSPTTPCYSIIVPVYNGAETLADCLMRLTQQKYPADCYEVVVVDDGSTDDSAAIAERFPARLIRLGRNQGRIVARNTGAQAAAYDTLVFVDSRVLFPADGLRRIAEVEYLPQYFFVDARGEGRGWFNRMFVLIRRRYYRPPIPLIPEEAAQHGPFYLTPDNFERAAKGTTALACPRDLWLACQPENRSRHAHDDIPILRAMVAQKPLLKRNDITVTYLQRERMSDVLHHLFMRGPRFASYYLRRGGPLYGLWIAALAMALVGLAGLVVLAVLIGPGRTLLLALALALLLLFGAGLYLAARPSDVLLVMALLPPAAGVFIAGVVWGLLGAERRDARPDVDVSV
jgi:glycosyltransferase involved in cell wall biosynthesis